MHDNKTTALGCLHARGSGRIKQHLKIVKNIAAVKPAREIGETSACWAHNALRKLQYPKVQIVGQKFIKKEEKGRKKIVKDKVRDIQRSVVASVYFQGWLSPCSGLV